MKVWSRPVPAIGRIPPALRFSHPRLLQALRWPETKHDQLAALNQVVHVMADAIQMNPTNTREASVADSLADARLKHEELQCPLKILADGLRRRRAVFTPPCISAFNLARRA